MRERFKRLERRARAAAAAGQGHDITFHIYSISGREGRDGDMEPFTDQAYPDLELYRSREPFDVVTVCV